ncbi:MAG: cytochrome c3 family protein [Coriobacteriia bacterium]
MEEATKPVARSVRKKRTLITVGIIAVVLLALVAGGLVWHQQPTFCSTVCHKVMAPYVESWQDGDLLAAAHGKADVKCLDCHEPTLGQQITEATKFVTGDYETPLPFVKIGTSAYCLKCHGAYDDLAEKTADYLGQPGVNPHEAHLGQLPCYDCHRMHDQSQMYCSNCHVDQKVPPGWEASSELDPDFQQ